MQMHPHYVRQTVQTVAAHYLQPNYLKSSNFHLNLTLVFFWLKYFNQRIPCQQINVWIINEIGIKNS
jgi:hypothetical protein